MLFYLVSCPLSLLTRVSPVNLLVNNHVDGLLFFFFFSLVFPVNDVATLKGQENSPIDLQQTVQLTARSNIDISLSLSTSFPLESEKDDHVSN